jgi:arginyl-tRNA synthetase
MFIRALLKHNQGVEFEIVLAHDDRVEDGSAEHYKNLEIEIPNLKVVTRTFKDTTDYLDRLMVHYDTKNIFEEEFRNGLKENVEKFKNGTLYDISRSFL